MKVVVAQKGSREHFLAARALHRKGHLARLVVDWYTPGGSVGRWIGGSVGRYFGGSMGRWIGGRGRAALAARSEAIPDGLVRAFPFRSLLWKWHVRRRTVQGCLYEAYAETDAAFARRVARLLLPEHGVFFGYSYASLEAMQAERARGKFIILDQIDASCSHYQILREESHRWPAYCANQAEPPAAYFERNRNEWECADVIVANSEWTRSALIEQGVPASKIEIIPLAYELDANPSFQLSAFRVSAFSPLRVLWLGTISLGKGIQYLVEAAKLLANEPVEFIIAGPLAIKAEAVSKAPANMRWLGQVPRSQTAEVYAQADVFVFPTLSDGFGLTQLEALAHGLPVIATPNCGRVVEEGKTGFLIPPRDPEALAGAILKFVRNRQLLEEMRPRCLEAVKAFSVEAYGKRLVEIILKHRSS